MRVDIGKACNGIAYGFQCSRKLPRPYRTFSQKESKSLPEPSNFYPAELLSLL